MRCPLEIALKSSRLLESMIAAIHLIAAIALVQALANPLALAVSILALAVSVVVSVHRQRRKSARVLVLGREGSLEIHSDSGVVCARLLPGSVDFGWALWMQWRENVADGDCARGRVEAMMLLPDGVSGGNWRHLRTWLRHEAGERFSGDRA
jgi:hypothetical protein